MEIHVDINDTDDKYLKKVSKAMTESLEEFTPDFLIYNAGTDCLEGDPLGHLIISDNGIIKRDELVFNLCLERKIPIAMLMSGGYQKSNGELIGRSIENIIIKNQLN